MTQENFILNTRRKKNELSQCRICGSSAVYSYFGVISCDACKIFFKRNAHYGQNHLTCLYGGQCDININNRHTCMSCRLEKCFQKGMKAERIRRSIVNTKINTISNISAKLNQRVKLFEIDSLNRKNSTLDNTQWNLLSNIVQNYQELELLSISQVIKDQINAMGIINQSTLHNLLTSFYETAGNSLRSNGDIARLQSDDRSILLHTAVANVTCAGGQLIYYHSQLIYYDIIWKYLEDIYGKVSGYYRQLSSKFAQSDMVVWKLSIALFALSTNTRIFCRNIQGEYRDIHQILKIQDKYAELTWKYLLHKYDYRQAMKRYIRMIEWFLSLTSFMQYACNVDVYVNDVESLVEQTEMALILDDVDGIVNEGISSTKTSELISSMDLEM